MRKLYFILSLYLLPACLYAQAQQPFYNEIAAFRKQDSLDFPERNAILFVGSSSFRMWKDVQKDFPEHTIINRGFGGSSLTHVIHYFSDVIKPYRPKQIVIYAGENDLTVDTVTADHVFQRFTTLYQMIRDEFPDAHVLYVSIKPSPSRRNLMPEMHASNLMIRNFLKHERNANFVNVYDAMLINGAPDPSLFIQDNLHMNAKGYSIWQKKIKPHLKK